MMLGIASLASNNDPRADPGSRKNIAMGARFKCPESEAVITAGRAAGMPSERADARARARQAMLAMDDTGALLRFVQRPNAASLAEGRAALQAAGRYSELVALYQRRGPHQAALGLLRALSQARRGACRLAQRGARGGGAGAVQVVSGRPLLAGSSIWARAGACRGELSAMRCRRLRLLESRVLLQARRELTIDRLAVRT